MKDLLKKNEFLRPLKEGEIVEGKIIARAKSSIFLDLGNKGIGIIYGKEFFEAKDFLKDLKIGDRVFAKVLDPDNEEGFVELSASKASKELAFETLKEKEGKIIKVKITGANKGGLLTEISGIPAFLPVSQLSLKNYPKVRGNEEKILKRLQKFIGKEFEVKILSLNQKGKQIILSERLAEMEKAKTLLKNYKVGDLIDCKVTGLTDFGIFVEFGEGLEGLIQIFELGEKIPKTGEKIKAKIKEIQKGKVFLSLKI
jgi:ribosomal protein S1